MSEQSPMINAGLASKYCELESIMGQQNVIPFLTVLSQMDYPVTQELDSQDSLRRYKS